MRLKVAITALMIVPGCAEDGSPNPGLGSSGGETASSSQSASDSGMPSGTIGTTSGGSGSESGSSGGTPSTTSNSATESDSDSTSGGSEESTDSSSTGESPNEGDWEPPIGIPVPPFGIFETAEVDCADCTVITASNLDDLENIPPGTVVELEGGPFTGGSLTISANGTADAPVFVRSKNPDAPVTISHRVEMGGTYLIVEHINFDQGLEDKNVAMAGTRIALRHSEIHAFRPGHFSTTLFLAGGEDLVVYDNEIHDNGDPGVVGEHDVHGIGGSNVHRVWIVDSHLHHNRGDSIQFGHQAGNTLGDFYIGRNEMHDDGENCVDIKEASNVVVSENDLHDPNSGVAVVFHDCPVNASLIYNDVHDATVGLSLPSLESACDGFSPIDLFVARNAFVGASTGVEGWGSGKRYGIAGNTFEMIGDAIDIDNEAAGSILSTTDRGVDEVFNRFEAVYGIDISGD